MKTWTIYRGGLTWTVSAPDLFTALHRAQLWAVKDTSFAELRASEDSGEPLREPSKVTPYAKVPFELRALPAYCFMHDRKEYALRRDGCTVLLDSCKMSQLRVLRALKRRIHSWQSAHHAPREYVSVARFKSGARKGEIKWPKNSSPAQREDVLGKIAHNAALESKAVEELDASAHTIAVLRELPSPDFDDRKQLARTLALVEDVKRLAKWPLHISAWADAEIARLRKLDGELASVEEHGFGPGTVCLLKPDPHSTDPGDPSGRVTIRRVYVEESEWRGDVHYREFEHEGRSWCGVPVDCFEALPTTAK